MPKNVESDIKQHVDVDALDYKLRRCDFSAQSNCQQFYYLWTFLSLTSLRMPAWDRLRASITWIICNSRTWNWQIRDCVSSLKDVQSCNISIYMSVMISAYKALAIAAACWFDMHDMMFEPSDGAGCAPGQECKLTTRPIRPALANSFGPDSMFTSMYGLVNPQEQ